MPVTELQPFGHRHSSFPGARRMRSYRDTPTLGLLRTLVRASQQLQTWMNENAAAYGLSSSEFDLVMTLGNTEGLRMCDAATRMLTSAPNLTRVAKRLEERGLVERQRSPDSDREVIIRLTSPGNDLFVAAYPRAYQQWRERFDARLSESEQSQLANLLLRLSAPAD
jgi:DNA-binding MarR family transcriptional regulator